MRHHDGTATEVLYNVSVYRDAGGNVLGVFAAARDVTKQVHAQRDIVDRQAREQERLVELERFQRLTLGCVCSGRSSWRRRSRYSERNVLSEEATPLSNVHGFPTFTAPEPFGLFAVGLLCGWREPHNRRWYRLVCRSEGACFDGY
jgi:hypothetical protein